MPAYIVAQLKVHDPAMFQRYRDAVTPLVDRFGGRYRVRGGELEVLEGDWPFPRLTSEFQSQRCRPAVLRSARIPEDPAPAREVGRRHRHDRRGRVTPKPHDRAASRPAPERAKQPTGGRCRSSEPRRSWTADASTTILLLLSNFPT